MAKLKNHRVAILVADGFEQVELSESRAQLEAAGAVTSLVALESGTVRGWSSGDSSGDWGDTFQVDRALAEARVEDFEALVLPGGTMSLDVLRTSDEAVTFVRAFAESGKPVAAICHGPWTLIEADLVAGRKITSFPSLRTDANNAGAFWIDEEVVVDENIITSRKAGDVNAFCASIVEALQSVDARESRAP